MHIVYLFKFKREQLPNLYIGSKSNCSIINGKIQDKRGKIYEGSSESDLYLSALAECDYEVFVLGEFDVYNDALMAEKDSHIANDVVASPNYFNKSVASINSYTDPDYATYKNLLTGKIARLPRLHPEVLNGNWVGVTKGTILSEEEKKLRGRSGEENSFYGKKHTDESKILQGIGNKGRIKSPEEISNWIEKVAKLPMTEEHKLIVSIANKDKIMLKNFGTGEVLKVDRLDLDLYDVNIWKNPATIQKRASCEHCGITSTVGNIVRWHNDNCKERKYENN